MMATSAPELRDTATVGLSAAIDAISRHLGFDEARLRTVARALQEAGLLQVGAPHAGPRVDLRDFVSLVIGIAADVPLHKTAAAVAAIDALVPAGAPPPENVPKALADRISTAGHTLDAIVSLMAEDDKGMRKLRIEIVAEPWTEFVVHFLGGSVQRYLKAGAVPGHWGARGYRKAIIINGDALADAIDALFGF